MTLVGQQIGRYRILEQVGVGGMSVVYKGLDTALEREVAIKVLHPHLALKQESRQRLAQEARAVAKLSHRNILEIFDVSLTEAASAFLVTEYIQGKTLKDYAQAHRFHPPELAAMAIRELAEALAHAHQAGVIHRDIKPENVMVRDDGVLKLMDFGIAKLLDRDERMTQTGALVGSPAHMAPEIIEGEEACPASDVFSLGTLLFWLATGQLPFQAANATATLKRIVDGAYEDPRTLEPSLSDDLAGILDRCLKRSPAERFQDAGQLQHALDDYLAAAGLDRPGESLASFFADPPSFVPGFTHRLCERRVVQAEQYLKEKRPAKALALLSQVLALEPRHERATTLVQALKRRRRRRRLASRVALSALAVSALAALGVLTPRAWRTWAAHQRAAAALSVTPPPGAPGTHAQAADRAPFNGSSSSPAPLARVGPPVPAERTRPLRHDPHPAAPGLVRVAILVRPYGYVRVDEEPRSSQPLAMHTLLLRPGKHRVTVSCELCEPYTQEIDVLAGGPNRFPLPARARPAHLVFHVTPEDAVVSVNGQERPARTTDQSPFEIDYPPGPFSFRQTVSYEIRAPGFTPLHQQTTVLPGQRAVLSGKLERP